MPFAPSGAQAQMLAALGILRSANSGSIMYLLDMRLNWTKSASPRAIPLHFYYNVCQCTRALSKVITFDKIDDVLPVADFLYLAVPETEETKGLINKVRLDSLKSSCGIVSIGRQSVLDYEALRIKLEKNELAGAILDVFSHEPIPKNSKLWDTPNLIITPHISSDSKGNYIKMVLKIFFKNLKLFIDKKELINQIDIKLGY